MGLRRLVTPLGEKYSHWIFIPIKLVSIIKSISVDSYYRQIHASLSLLFSIIRCKAVYYRIEIGTLFCCFTGFLCVINMHFDEMSYLFLTQENIWPKEGWTDRRLGKKLCNNQVHNLYCMQNIIIRIKARRMNWAGYVACMRSGMHVGFWWEGQKQSTTKMT